METIDHTKNDIIAIKNEGGYGSTMNQGFSKTQHPHALKFDSNQTIAFANSFIPMTSRDLNSVPPTAFPAI